MVQKAPIYTPPLVSIHHHDPKSAFLYTANGFYTPPWSKMCLSIHIDSIHNTCQIIDLRHFGSDLGESKIFGFSVAERVPRPAPPKEPFKPQNPKIENAKTASKESQNTPTGVILRKEFTKHVKLSICRLVNVHVNWIFWHFFRIWPFYLPMGRKLATENFI